MLVVWTVMACSEVPSPPPEHAVEVEAKAHPQDTLDGMDSRTPLPMPPMMALHQKEQMRGHLEATQELSAALAESDWAAIEAAASKLGSSPQMAMTCDHMGAAAEGFTPQALDFHARADKIVEAAQAQDQQAVLAATAATLAACTACHNTWRQQIVSPEAYAELTGGAGPMGH